MVAGLPSTVGANLKLGGAGDVLFNGLQLPGGMPTIGIQPIPGTNTAALIVPGGFGGQQSLNATMVGSGIVELRGDVRYATA